MKITSENGFTIIELMISIMVMAILAFIAAPSMRGMIERNKIDSSVTSMMRSIVAARSEAIARNQPVVMCSSSNGTSCTTGGWDNGWISFADSDADGTLDASEAVLGVSSASSGVTLRSSAADPNTLVFLADGTITEVTDFRVCGPDADLDEAYAINISVTGRPRRSSGASVCP